MPSHLLLLLIKCYTGLIGLFYTSKSPIGALGAATFWPTQLALLGIVPPTEVTQRLVLLLGL